MNVLTLFLVSLVVARAFVPREPWRAWAVVVVAGTISNIDSVSSMMGPYAYLGWHRTYAHSIVISLLLSFSLAAIYFFATRDQLAEDQTQSTVPRPAMLPFFGAAAIAGLLHLALDCAQSVGTMVFWPFSHQRIALDWLPRVDPWIIAIMAGALALPELRRLVSDEIGAKSKGPRGRVGAIVGLVLLASYAGLRADLHSNAVATLQNRSYAGEAPRRVAAYAGSGSLVSWHGVVETERALRQPIVDVSPNARFNPDNGLILFKPEPSPTLDQAQRSDAAKRFLVIAQFPKADIEKTPEGYDVEIRDIRDAATGETQQEISARIHLDSNGRVLNDELVWLRGTARR
jgi:hypothetical protein